MVTKYNPGDIIWFPAVIENATMFDDKVVYYNTHLEGCCNIKPPIIGEDRILVDNGIPYAEPMTKRIENKSAITYSIDGGI